MKKRRTEQLFTHFSFFTASAKNRPRGLLLLLASGFFPHVFVLSSPVAEVSGAVTKQRLPACGDIQRPSGGTAAAMYGASGIPELIPPGGPPRQPGPAGQFNPGHPQGDRHGGGSNPQRLGLRAPKLGQIGRSKKVDLDDEDLDDIMNNNGQCAVSPIS